MGSFDLQAKVSTALIAVLVPVFFLVTLLQNQLTRPIWQAEMENQGIASATEFAKILQDHKGGVSLASHGWIEKRLQEFLYYRPHVVRMDVLVQDPVTHEFKTVATNIEDNPDVPVDLSSEAPLGEKKTESAALSANLFGAEWVDQVRSDVFEEFTGEKFWKVMVPVKANKKVVANIHALISQGWVDRVVETMVKVSVGAAIITVVLLILILNVVLKKTIAHDRKLRLAENQNLALSTKLHETQRKLMNTEKLAVMGQLTASFAHEIGTPLNAIGGHLQLLQEELVEAKLNPQKTSRLEIIQGQVHKIETIVKDFLHNTAKPKSQKQLFDLNLMVSQVGQLMMPRIIDLGVEFESHVDSGLGPLRVVPLEMEQVLVNLVNNSLDSLKSKKKASKFIPKLRLVLTTKMIQKEGKDWAVVEVLDTGEGISKTQMAQVKKPFFTTKKMGEGTGLGLTISSELVRKYKGELTIESKEGYWTRVSMLLPYEVIHG